MKAVYEIRNKKTNESYLGQTQDIESRFKQHKNSLAAGKHSSPKLQKRWNDYGGNVFNFNSLKECNDRIELEYWERYYWENSEKVLNAKSPPVSPLKRNKLIKFIQTIGNFYEQLSFPSKDYLFFLHGKDGDRDKFYQAIRHMRRFLDYREYRMNYCDGKHGLICINKKRDSYITFTRSCVGVCYIDEEIKDWY